MPWKECDCVSLREEFVAQACQEGVNIAALARRYGISRKTAYKWMNRYKELGDQGLKNQSRKPKYSPDKTDKAIEALVVGFRMKHPAWGGRKLHHYMKRLRLPAPSPSTITRILRDHGFIDPLESKKRQACQRFERDAPNELWQMDFKGPIHLAKGEAHALTVLDDHSRYSLGIHVCKRQLREEVQKALEKLFSKYGRPWAMLMDNASIWNRYSKLEVWLMRLDIEVHHGRPHHPQTQGKDERFHRTLKAEVLQNRVFKDRDALKTNFDTWRRVYNYKRPHEALEMKTPSERYRVSDRLMPARLPELEYGPEDEVRRVDHCGQFRFKRRKLRVGNAFTGQRVALRATKQEGLWHVCYGIFRVGQVDLEKVGPHEFANVQPSRPRRFAPGSSGLDEDE